MCCPEFRRFLFVVALSAVVALLALVEAAPVPKVRPWSKEITNSIGMKLVRIPAGKLTMGSPNEEKDRKDDEQQHGVEISQEFWLGIREVTQKQFKTVMGYNPSYFSRDGEGKTGLKYDDDSKPAGGKEKVPADTIAFPVENVSWQEAMEFCNKLSALPAEKESGRKCRLPTEAEWEYSCRGGAPASRVFHFGNSLSSKQANFDGSPFGRAEKDTSLERTCKVGNYEKNGFGLYDMHGNVWEWCLDWYQKDYEKDEKKDPKGPAKGASRVIRGGSWLSDGCLCRASQRLRRSPTDRYLSVGFRVTVFPSAR
jgi:formylglycine-generating enzyme required for sulfatase activity